MRRHYKVYKPSVTGRIFSEFGLGFKDNSLETLDNFPAINGAAVNGPDLQTVSRISKTFLRFGATDDPKMPDPLEILAESFEDSVEAQLAEQSRGVIEDRFWGKTPSLIDYDGDYDDPLFLVALVVDAKEKVEFPGRDSESWPAANRDVRMKPRWKQTVTVAPSKPSGKPTKTNNVQRLFI